MFVVKHETGNDVEEDRVEALSEKYEEGLIKSYQVSLVTTSKLKEHSFRALKCEKIVKLYHI